MIPIQVDEEVFEFLKSAARPFEEASPNDVLRRLLLDPREENVLNVATAPPRRREKRQETTSAAFMAEFLRARFGDGFRTRSPYRTMFESADTVVYFQNFNKPDSPNLWYRLRAKAIRDMRGTRKAAYVCLTNPAERLAYVLDLKLIIEKAEHAAGWLGEDDLEVNIDHADGRWRELNWSIEAYLERLR